MTSFHMPICNIFFQKFLQNPSDFQNGISYLFFEVLEHFIPSGNENLIRNLIISLIMSSDA